MPKFIKEKHDGEVTGETRFYLRHGRRDLPRQSPVDGCEAILGLAQRRKQTVSVSDQQHERSPRELQQKLDRLGIGVDASHFYTSALATASFLATQHPDGSAYVIGETGLTNALYEARFSMNDINPDYVVVGETRSYSFEKLERAVHLVRAGAKLIGTNPDLTGPVEGGVVPATGVLIAPIELATGNKAYFRRKTQSAYDASRTEKVWLSPGGDRYHR